MRWADVIPAACTALEADTALMAALGAGALIEATTARRLVRAPSVSWFLVADPEGELWEPVLVQWDLVTASWAAMATIEARVRAVLHHDTPTVLGGVTMWSQVVDARTVPIETEKDPNLVHRQLDVRFTALRSKYVVVATP